MRALLRAAFAVLAATTSATAGVDIGDRVRIVGHGWRGDPMEFTGAVVGQVLDVDAEGLVVKPAGRPERRLSWTTIADIRVSLGRHSDAAGGARKGALLLGIPAGIVIGTLACFDPDYEGGASGPCGSGFNLMAGGVALAAGALAGAALGGALGGVSTERWMAVDKPSRAAAFGIMPVRRGVGVRFTLRF